MQGHPKGPSSSPPSEPPSHPEPILSPSPASPPTFLPICIPAKARAQVSSEVSFVFTFSWPSRLPAVLLLGAISCWLSASPKGGPNLAIDRATAPPSTRGLTDPMCSLSMCWWTATPPLRPSGGFCFENLSTPPQPQDVAFRPGAAPWHPSLAGAARDLLNTSDDNLDITTLKVKHLFAAALEEARDHGTTSAGLYALALPLKLKFKDSLALVACSNIFSGCRCPSSSIQASNLFTTWVLSLGQRSWG